MKPIEIHIEGYKIVISEDGKENSLPSQENEGRRYVDSDSLIITTNPPISVPSPYRDDAGWWERPNATWRYDSTNWIVKTTTTTPVRDFMGNPSGSCDDYKPIEKLKNAVIDELDCIQKE